LLDLLQIRGRGLSAITPWRDAVSPMTGKRAPQGHFLRGACETPKEVQ